MSKLRFLAALSVLLLTQVFVSAQPGQAVELPMLFRGPMPAVEVMVNGKGPFLFAIDTGGQGAARLDSSLVEKLGIKPSGQVQASDGSGQNVRMLDTYTIDTLKIGELVFENVTAASRNYNNNPNLPKIDGILAFNLFRDHLLTLDYPGKKVRIEKGALPAANGVDILDFAAPSSIPVIEFQVGSQKIKAHIDSGNTVAPFILPTAVVEKAALASEPVIVGKARTVSNEIEIKQVRLKDTIRLGGFEFAEPSVNFPSFSDANIGSRFLSEFSITFDQKNMRLKLNRTKTAEKTATASSKIENAKDFAGSYGDRAISEENGELYLQRPGGRKLKLIKTSGDEFTLEQVAGARLKFVRGASGKVVEIQVLTQQGVWEKAARKDP